MRKFQAKQSRVIRGVQGKSNITQVLKSTKRFESHSTQQNIIFQHYYKSYCDYLLKMGRMDEEQAVSEQLTLRDFKKWSFHLLKSLKDNF